MCSIFGVISVLRSAGRSSRMLDTPIGQEAAIVGAVVSPDWTECRNRLGIHIAVG